MNIENNLHRRFVSVQKGVFRVLSPVPGPLVPEADRSRYYKLKIYHSIED
jgi:hypothetical protein